MHDIREEKIEIREEDVHTAFKGDLTTFICEGRDDLYVVIVKNRSTNALHVFHLDKLAHSYHDGDLSPEQDFKIEDEINGTGEHRAIIIRGPAKENKDEKTRKYLEKNDIVIANVIDIDNPDYKIKLEFSCKTKQLTATSENKAVLHNSILSFDEILVNFEDKSLEHLAVADVKDLGANINELNKFLQENENDYKNLFSKSYKKPGDILNHLTTYSKILADFNNPAFERNNKSPIKLIAADKKTRSVHKASDEDRIAGGGEEGAGISSRNAHEMHDEMGEDGLKRHLINLIHHESYEIEKLSQLNEGQFGNDLRQKTEDINKQCVELLGRRSEEKNIYRAGSEISKNGDKLVGHVGQESHIIIAYNPETREAVMFNIWDKAHNGFEYEQKQHAEEFVKKAAGGKIQAIRISAEGSVPTGYADEYLKELGVDFIDNAIEVNSGSGKWNVVFDSKTKQINVKDEKGQEIYVDSPFTSNVKPARGNFTRKALGEKLGGAREILDTPLDKEKNETREVSRSRIW